jgi:hypothetical protein
MIVRIVYINILQDNTMAVFHYTFNHDYVEGFDREFMVNVVGIAPESFTEEGHCEEIVEDDGWPKSHKFMSYCVAYKDFPWPEVKRRFQLHRLKDPIFDYKKWVKWQVK